MNASRPDLSFVTPIVNDYMRFGPPNYRPSPKQTLFLSPIVNNVPEVMFGGRAGGGKSVALLAARLQYVHVPGYSALLLRRTYKDLALPGALMDMSHDWLDGTDAKWNREQHQWVFPSGRRLTFGYLENDNDVGRYKSSAYTYIGFDELSEFSEHQYTFLFSRLRSAIGVRVPWRVRAASNPGGPGHCLPNGDVLTPTGWVDIRYMQVGQPVYTVDREGCLVETTVSQVHRHDYDGPMVKVKTRNLRMQCTPNHRVAKLNGRRGAEAGRLFSLVPFAELPGQANILRAPLQWKAAELGEVRQPEYRGSARGLRRSHPRNVQPQSLTGVHFAALFGWYITEGCLVNRRISISQSKPATRLLLRELLDSAGFKVSWNSVGATIYSAGWWQYLADLNLGKSREKYIPDFLKGSGENTLRALLTAMMDGDGHWEKRGTSGAFFTTSRQLSNDFAEIATKLGYVVYVSSRQRENRVGLSYSVAISRTCNGATELLTGHHSYDVETNTKRKSKIETTHYTGEVFCIGVENTQNFVVRQNGSVWVSGNSFVQQRFIDSNQPDRLFIPSYIEDNPGIDAERYEKQALSHLDPVTYEQLRHGDWNIRPGGNMFKREWFDVVEEHDLPRRLAATVRYWDLAASDESKKDADYTAGCKMGYSDHTGKWYVLDMVRLRKDPGAIEDLILQTAKLDGQECFIRMEQEPGASSEYLMRRMRTMLGGRFPFEPVRVDKKKEVRARPASASCKAKDIVLVRGPWIPTFLNEVVAFPNSKVHDDQVDSFVGAYMMLANRSSDLTGLTQDLSELVGSTLHKPMPRNW